MNKRAKAATPTTHAQEDAVRQQIAASGLIASEARVGLLVALGSVGKPALPEDLFQMRWPGAPRALASIYRGLAELHSVGLVRKYSFGDRGRIAYGVARTGDGLVLICMDCGASELLDVATSNNVRVEALKVGYALSTDAISLPATCTACLDGRRARMRMRPAPKRASTTLRG